MPEKNVFTSLSLHNVFELITESKVIIFSLFWVFQLMHVLVYDLSANALVGFNFSVN